MWDKRCVQMEGGVGWCNCGCILGSTSEHPSLELLDFAAAVATHMVGVDKDLVPCAGLREVEEVFTL